MELKGKCLTCKLNGSDQCFLAGLLSRVVQVENDEMEVSECPEFIKITKVVGKKIITIKVNELDIDIYEDPELYDRDAVTISENGYLTIPGRYLGIINWWVDNKRSVISNYTFESLIIGGNENE